MIRKQAIWCQCATVFHIVLAAACISSLQKMTVVMDVFWFIYFTLTTVITFCTAEHGTVVGITPDIWLRCEKILKNVIASTIILWSGFHWSVFHYIATTIVMSTALSYVSPLAVSIFVLVCMSTTTAYSMLLVVVLWTVSQWWTDHWFKNTLNKSIASYELRRAYLGKATVIITEALLLWHVRCLHRFPHVFRWRPVLFGFITILFSCIHCHMNVKNTHVSRNAVIKRAGHGMAASLTAAKACPVCRTCLTQLDMESSFDDGF